MSKHRSPPKDVSQLLEQYPSYEDVIESILELEAARDSPDVEMFGEDELNIDAWWKAEEVVPSVGYLVAAGVVDEVYSDGDRTLYSLRDREEIAEALANRE